MSDKSHEHEAATGGDKAKAAAPTREKDTRQILRGVQMPDGKGGTKTCVAGDEDALEQAMTRDQYFRLLATDSIGGNWKVKDKAKDDVKVDAPTLPQGGARHTVGGGGGKPR